MLWQIEKSPGLEIRVFGCHIYAWSLSSCPLLWAFLLLPIYIYIYIYIYTCARAHIHTWSPLLLHFSRIWKKKIDLKFDFGYHVILAYKWTLIIIYSNHSIKKIKSWSIIIIINMVRYGWWENCGKIWLPWFFNHVPIKHCIINKNKIFLLSHKVIN